VTLEQTAMLREGDEVMTTTLNGAPVYGIVTTADFMSSRNFVVLIRWALICGGITQMLTHQNPKEWKSVDRVTP
jgi:hypothetical protein